MMLHLSLTSSCSCLCGRCQIAAVKYEDPALVAVLIEAGADLTLQDRKGRRAADFAKLVDQSVQNEMLQLFNMNDDGGQQKRGKNNRRRKSMVYIDAETRAMLEAVSAGNLDRVRQLLYEGHSVNAQDDDGNTALIFAAESESQIVDLLLKSGGEVDHQNKVGLTALMVAVRAEDTESVRLLLAANSSTSIKNAEGMSAIEFAQRTVSETILQLVLGLSEGLVLNKKSAPKLAMEVMRRGSLPSCSSVDRRTRAFFESISEGDYERVHRILKMEFDVNCKDDGGCCPLHFAAEGEKELIILLLENGAHVNVINIAGETPLMNAIKFGDSECVKLLLQAGGDVHAKDGAGRDLMYYAEASNSSATVALISEAMG